MTNKPQTRETLVRDLVESDAGYFDAGAERHDIGGATIARLVGMESLAAGCVIHRVEPTKLPGALDGWLGDAEARVAGWGVPKARLYLTESIPALEAALQRRGYRPRREIAYMLAATTQRPEGVSLVPVRTDGDWQKKLELHARAETAPDGYDATASAWVAMERRRCDAGYMVPYLIVHKDDVVGAVNKAPWRSVLRIKNLVVAPEHRRRGIATAAARGFAAVAAESGHGAAGVFALAHEPAVGIYEKAGYEIVAEQTEWLKELGNGTRR